MASQPSSQSAVTFVPGVFGDSVHLNDGYFDGSGFIPSIVCHGRVGTHRVGPVNSFRFPGGPGQLDYYQNIRGTAFITGLMGGAAVAGAMLPLTAPAASLAIPAGRAGLLASNNSSLIGWYVRGRGVVGYSLPNTTHAALGADLGLVCGGEVAVAGAEAFTIVRDAGSLVVIGSRNFGGNLAVSEAARRAILEYFR